MFFPLRALAAGYTDLFRGLPLIIVLYLVGFGIPGLQGSDGTRIPAAVLGTIALILTYSAYVSEVFRAGIEAVHPSQRLAARSLGLSHGQTMRLVVLPQAVRKVTPALMNDFIAMQKDVGLISVLGAVDAVRAAQIETAKFFNFTPYVLAGLLFVLLALPMIRFTDWYTARLRAREQSGDRMSVLRVEGVHKAFGDTAVLQGLDLEISAHEVVALIGASGSGKSTLLRAITLLEPIGDGQLWLGDTDISDPRIDGDAVRSRIGVVFRAYNLFPHLSVLDNVTLGLRHVHRQSRDAAEARGLELLERIGLTPLARAYPDRLSGGQQQRVAIARALASSPELLLPTRSRAPSTRSS